MGAEGAYRDTMLYVTGSAEEGFTRAMEYWETTNISYKKLERSGNKNYIIQHLLGYKRRPYFSTVVGTILKELGYHRKDPHLGNEILSFSIVKQERGREREVQSAT